MTTQYRTLLSTSGTKFDTQVNEYLQDGWELYGNPYSCEGYLCQAMIRKTKKRKALDTEKIEFADEDLVW